MLTYSKVLTGLTVVLIDTIVADTEHRHCGQRTPYDVIPDIVIPDLSFYTPPCLYRTDQLFLVFISADILETDTEIYILIW